ncbi:MAG: MarR family transcriptional regulator [Acidimicrobiia bacterium]|nr:MarR family transcriptional regulator [Acidimicrobiia bacterium]
MRRTSRPRPDEERLAAWEALLESHALLVEILGRELQGETGLSLHDYDVLLTLYRAPDRRLRMTELAQAVVLSKSGLTRLVDRLEAGGLVRRAACPTDRRSVFASLTPRGRATLRRAAPVHLRGIEEHFGRHLPPGEARTLARSLGRVSAALRSREEGPTEATAGP